MKSLAVLLAICIAAFVLSSSYVAGDENSFSEVMSAMKTFRQTKRTANNYIRRQLRDGDDDDDDDGNQRKRKGDDDDDDDDRNPRNLGDDDDDDDDGERRPRRPSGDSSSVTKLKGVLRIVVFGNGEMCFVKIFQRRYTYREQFGATTSTSAFLNLYGHAGAIGVAYGVVRAKVMAFAHRRGSQCEASVTSFVIAKTHDLDPNDGVSVMVNGAAGGEALAMCD